MLTTTEGMKGTTAHILEEVLVSTHIMSIPATQITNLTMEVTIEGLMIDVKAMPGTITVNTLPILTPHNIIGRGAVGTTENLIPIEIMEVRHAPIQQIITAIHIHQIERDVVILTMIETLGLEKNRDWMNTMVILDTVAQIVTDLNYHGDRIAMETVMCLRLKLVLSKRTCV